MAEWFDQVVPLGLQWPYYPQSGPTKPAPDFLLHRRGKRAGAALADLKAYEDAAPFYTRLEWRHGIKRQQWDNYIAVCGRARLPFVLMVFEMSNSRIGILRNTPAGVIQGTGKGEAWVYWKQDAFSWIDGCEPHEGAERAIRPYSSLTDQPTKEVFDRATKHLGHGFDRALKLGLEAEQHVARFLERKGFTLWRLCAETAQGRRG